MEKNQITNRLKIAEDQVRGVQNMVIEQRSCKEILQQINAVESAINNISIILLENHAQISIENIVQNGDETIEIKKLMKTISNFVKK